MSDSSRAVAIDAAAKRMREAHDAHELGWKAIAEIAFEEADRSLDLVGRAEVAEMLGVHRNNVTRNHPDLPDPEWRPKTGPLWRRETIETYKESAS